MKYVFFVAVFAALSVATTAGGTTATWRVVKSKSVSGQFAVTAVSATIKKPKRRGIAVRLIGRVSSGNGVIACSRNFSVSSNSRTYSKAGTFTLPVMVRADSCQVTASVGGSGKVTVQILRLV
jgi:hypothetical protein